MIGNVKSSSGSDCNSSVASNLINWLDSLESFQKHDEELVKNISRLNAEIEEDYYAQLNDHSKKNASEFINNEFYKFYAQPFRNACKIMKTFGGVWRKDLKVLDGAKDICLDDLYKDIQAEECLVYSFGLAEDWSFEDAMVDLGCKVRAFDPTVDDKKGRDDGDKFRFNKVGIAATTGETFISNEGVFMASWSLEECMKQMGDEGKRISLLKIDVESSEFECFSDWLDNGLFNHIDQLHIEVHSSYQFLGEENQVPTARFMIQLLDQLVNKYNFRLFSYSPNLYNERMYDLFGKFYSQFDVAFKKMKP